MVRTKRFGLVLTEEERNLISLLARYDGIWSDATLVRRIIFEAARMRGLLPRKTVNMIEETDLEENTNYEP